VTLAIVSEFLYMYISACRLFLYVYFHAGETSLNKNNDHEDITTYVRIKIQLNITIRLLSSSRCSPRPPGPTEVLGTWSAPARPTPSG
jgi:hypothetical protein